MHILLMLALVILGCGLAKFSIILGAPFIVGGLFCFQMGTAQWREEQESLFFAIGLLSMAGMFVFGILRSIYQAFV